jgi:hypothetical protein
MRTFKFRELCHCRFDLIIKSLVSLHWEQQKHPAESSFKAVSIHVLYFVIVLCYIEVIVHQCYFVITGCYCHSFLVSSFFAWGIMKGKKKHKEFSLDEQKKF